MRLSRAAYWSGPGATAVREIARVRHLSYSNRLVKSLSRKIREASDSLVELAVFRSSFVTYESSRIECNEDAVRHVQEAGSDRLNWNVANNWTADDVIA